jgi:hypothetical protein
MLFNQLECIEQGLSPTDLIVVWAHTAKVAIHYNRRKVYIRAVLTHAQYDRGNWKRS